MEKFKLKRVRQCDKCPWKVTTDPFDIPDGYCPVKHKALEKTIAKAGEINIGGTQLVMACHHSDGNDEMYCVGWLNNQLGVGNNIGLRIQMMRCENIRDMKVVGEQHERFEDTLPENN